MTTRSLCLEWRHQRPHYYLVEGFGGWFVICCRDARVARRWGVQEFGRGGTLKVHPATYTETDLYARERGVSLPLPFEDAPVYP